MASRVLAALNFITEILLSGSAGTAGQSMLSAGPGLPPTWGTPSATYNVAVNFGTQPVDSRFFQITSITGITTSNKVTAAPSAVDGDELECDMLDCAAFVSAANTIDLYVNSYPGPVTGIRNLVLSIN